MKLKPDLQLSVAMVQAIVDQVIPASAVAAISRLHGGEMATVYEIAFVDANHPPLVLKVYPEDLHWKMQKEITVLDLIGDRLSVPVPRILLADDSKTLLGLNFTLMTGLKGTKLGLGGLEETLSPGERLSAHVQIGRLLREFHRIPMEAFGYIGAKSIVAPRPTNRLNVTYQFQRKLKEFVERGGDARLAERIAGHAAEREGLLDGCTQAVLCHNDLHAGNLLATVSDGSVRLTGVVDFEGARAGDPLMDIAKAAFYLKPDDRRAILEGYGELDRERGPETLDLYHLLFVLELWCWMAQIGNRQRLGGLALDLERYNSL
ncbi:phosphotransferase family protein [Bradyrhizobium sp. STM 3557]|uniref:phosphotransferase family protein n=1 Tax=Bradyrhizobium sp. STM 3557 TaxID=578920 RepID=UPI00389009F5